MCDMDDYDYGNESRPKLPAEENPPKDNEPVEAEVKDATSEQPSTKS